jgi:hypothetical protein
MTIRRLASVILLSTPLCVPLTGCHMGDLGEGLAGALECVFHDIGPFVTIPSDRGVLRAAVECEVGSDCTERRTIQQGGRIQFVIEIPEEHSKDLEVKSEPEGLFEVEGFSDEPKDCEDTREIQGSIRFSGSGEGGFVVFSDGEEVDRFSFEVYEPESVEIQFSDAVAFGDQGDWVVGSRLVTLEDEGSVRAIVRSASGVRLIGGPAPVWSTDDPDVASFQVASQDEESGDTTEFLAMASGYLQNIVPGDAGEATLRVTSGDMEATLPVVVSADAMGGAGGR